MDNTGAFDGIAIDATGATFCAQVLSDRMTACQRDKTSVRVALIGQLIVSLRMVNCGGD